MIAPIAVPICISAAATIAGLISIITKKISSCSQKKLQDYIVKYDIVSTAYLELSVLISLSLDDTFISDDEFSAMVQIYDLAISKLKQDNNNNDNNSNDCVDSDIGRITSTNSNKYNSDKNITNIASNESTRI
ncbi:hypothetical protein ACJMK2_034364 [Sinanodonta woodiana]|uniref:Uncharacterized protein n=1 Tax=Sinanodonta woodiana TaxID=1069815 RepID=A0ABD3WV48_SINWO